MIPLKVFVYWGGPGGYVRPSPPQARPGESDGELEYTLNPGLLQKFREFGPRNDEGGLASEGKGPGHEDLVEAF